MLDSDSQDFHFFLHHVSLTLPAGFGQSTFSTDPWWHFEESCVMFSKRYTLASFQLSIGVLRRQNMRTLEGLVSNHDG